MGYDHRIRIIDAKANGTDGIIFPNHISPHPALFNLLPLLFGIEIRDLSRNAPYFGR